MDRTEQMAADIAVKLNGGEWSDGKWYSEGHREAWIKAVQPYADEIERLRKALEWIAGCEGGDLFDLWKEMRDTARSALQQKDSE